MAEHLDGTGAVIVAAGPAGLTAEGILDGVENLSPLGRNGTHRYNNQDHSMLMVMTMVDQLLAGKVDREELSGINSDAEFQEER